MQDHEERDFMHHHQYFFSGSIIFITTLEGFLSVVSSTVKGVFLLLSVGLIVAATVLFVVDIVYSLHAIRIDIDA